MAAKCVGAWKGAPLHPNHPDSTLRVLPLADLGKRAGGDRRMWRVTDGRRPIGDLREEARGFLIRGMSVHGASFVLGGSVTGRASKGNRNAAAVVLAYLDWISTHPAGGFRQDGLTGAFVPYVGKGRPPKYLSVWNCLAGQRLREVEAWLALRWDERVVKGEHIRAHIRLDKADTGRELIWSPMAVGDLRVRLTNWMNTLMPTESAARGGRRADRLTGAPFEKDFVPSPHRDRDFLNEQTRLMANHLDFIEAWVTGISNPPREKQGSIPARPAMGVGAQGQVWSHDMVSAWKSRVLSISNSLNGLVVHADGRTYMEKTFGKSMGARKEGPRTFFKEGSAEVRLDHDVLGRAKAGKPERFEVTPKSGKGGVFRGLRRSWTVRDAKGKLLGVAATRAKAVAMIIAHAAPKHSKAGQGNRRRGRHLIRRVR